METQSSELHEFETKKKRVKDNLYVQTADIQTIATWEGVFDIVPTPGEQESFRRARVLSRLATSPPYTLRFLYGKLDELIGAGKWTVEMDYAHYTLFIEAAAEDQSWAHEIEATINKVKPCHIVYSSRPRMAEILHLGMEAKRYDVAHHYYLGRWVLGKKPFATVTDRGMSITKQDNTILPAMLEGIAGFTANLIAAVRINGTLTIDAFDVKQAQESIAVLEYSVSELQVQAITQIELLSDSGEVLSKAPVFVPISGAVRMKHTIYITQAGGKA